MRSSSLKIMNVILLIVLTAGLAIALYPLIRSIGEEVATADTALSDIQEKARILHTTDSVAINSAGDDLRRAVLEYDNIRGLAVFGPDDLLVYAYAANPGLIRIMGSERIELKAVDFTTRPVFDKIISAGSPGNDDYYTEGVFEILTYEDAYRVAVALFIFLLIFTTALFFSLLKLSGRGPVGGPSNKKLSPSKQSRSPRPKQKAEQDLDVPEENSTVHELAPNMTYSEDSPPLPIDGGDRLYAPDSLLCYEEFLEERLNNELKRAAAFDQDLLLAMVSCRKASVRENYIQLADEVRNHFEFHDLLFEYETNLIAVVLPNLDLEQGIAEFSEFQKNLFSENSSCHLDVAIGFSSRNGRLIRSDRLITEAKAAMKKAFKSRDARIIGFKPDPGKFRDYLAAHPST